MREGYVSGLAEVDLVDRPLFVWDSVTWLEVKDCIMKESDDAGFSRKILIFQ